MPIKQIRIPLAEMLESRDHLGTKDARLSNGFIDKVSAGRTVVKRPGLSTAFQGGVGLGQGITNYLNILYSISVDALNANTTLNSNFVQSTPNAGWAARKGMQGVGFSGRLWAIGGVDSGGTYYNDVYYSLDGVVWNQVTGAAPFAARANGQLVVLGSTMYLMGGQNNTGALGDVWASNDGVTWTLFSSNAFPKRFNFGACIANGKIYVAGGDGGGGAYYNDMYSSVNGGAWVPVSLNNPWAGRAKFGFTYFNNKFRILAGAMSPSLGNAAGDLWSSPDGVTWTRDSSNPFSQAATSIATALALTTQGIAFGVLPTITFGSGAAAATPQFVDFAEDGSDDDEQFLVGAKVTNVGAGYTSAPSVTFSSGNAKAYAFLAANGVLGDKRGSIVVAGSLCLFFATQNAGAFNNTGEIWQTTDGVTWTLFASGPAYSPRDTTVFYYGSLWTIGGFDGLTYYPDVWKSPIGSGTSTPLVPSKAAQQFRFNQTAGSVSTPLLVFKSPKDAYTFNASFNLLTKVTNASYPATTVPGLAYLDGTFYVMDASGRIWNSAINDFTSWNPVGVIAMQSEPNGGMAIAKYGQYIVALGVWTTEFFYDAAGQAPASPLLPSTTLISLVGCTNGDSMVEMQSSVVWIGQTKQEGRGIYFIENCIPIRISDPGIDRLLEADNLSEVHAYATGVFGHSLYVLTLVNTNITLAFDFHEKTWYVWTSRTPKAATTISSLSVDAYGLATAISASHGLVDGDPITISGSLIPQYNGAYNVNVKDANTVTFFVGKQLAATSGVQMQGYNESFFQGSASCQVFGSYFIQHYNNGQVMLLNMDNYTDSGNPIDFRAKTSEWDGGSMNYKTFPETNLVADVVNSNAFLRYTNDDYNTYSAYRRIDLSKTRQNLTRNGRARRRAWELRHTDPTPFRAFALEHSVEIGEF